MERFECRMEDHDGADDWTDVEETDAEEAARSFGERRSHSSGGEVLSQEDDSEVVYVRDDEGVVTKWRVSVGYIKCYRVDPIDGAE